MSRLRSLIRSLPIFRFAAGALLLGALLPAAGSSVPPEWRAGDYPERPASAWYGVEVAEFPSRLLAEGVERSLAGNGWGPVLLVDGPEGSCRVVLGEMARVADAWYVKKELAAQRIAGGRVVELPLAGDGRSARGFNTSPLLEPFTPTDHRDLPPGMTADDIRRKLRVLALEMDGDEGASPSAEVDNQMIRAFLDAWQAGNTAEEIVGRGAVIAAQRLWSTYSEPDIVLHLAGKVARGEWSAPPDQVEEARLLAGALLYSHRRDWRGAWAATRLLEGDRSRPLASRIDDRLRQAALLVELYDTADGPRPTPAQIRLHLRRTQEMIPAGSDLQAAAASVGLIYLQTFAWEGKWARVEELSRAWLDRHDDEIRPSGQAMLVRYLLAQSLERREAWEEAVELLASITGSSVDPAKRLRMGRDVRDLSLEARELRRRFQEEARRAVAANPEEEPAEAPGAGAE